jgi:Holliday junction resolvase RusA-like endonuclease
MILKKLPLCPSQNKQLMVSRGRMIKTSIAREFDQKMLLYKIKHAQIINNIKQNIGKDEVFKVDCYFVFHKKRIFTKTKELKRIDSDNLLKSTRDAVSKLIEHDDKFFVTGIVERIWCENESDEQSIVVLSSSKIRSLDDLQRSLQDFVLTE